MSTVLFLDPFNNILIRTLDAIPRVGECVVLPTHRANVTEIIHVIDKSFLKTFNITDEVDVIVKL